MNLYNVVGQMSLKRTSYISNFVLSLFSVFFVYSVFELYSDVYIKLIVFFIGMIGFCLGFLKILGE